MLQLWWLTLRCPVSLWSSDHSYTLPLLVPQFSPVDPPPLPSMHVTRPLAKRKNLLLCLDAFDTIYKPNLAVPAAYAFAANRHGINCIPKATASTPVESWKPHDYEPVAITFKDAFKKESATNPNYGKVTGLGAEKWWANVH